MVYDGRITDIAIFKSLPRGYIKKLNVWPIS